MIRMGLVLTNQSRYPAVLVSDPPKDEPTNDGSAEEDGLRRRRQVVFVTYPVQLEIYKA